MEQSDVPNNIRKLNFQAYYGRKNGDGFYFNYELLPLIHNFEFLDFIATASNNDHGGFLVITNNQYIIGYNSGFGIGTHRVAFARVMKDLTGGGLIRSEQEVNKLYHDCTKKFITARITYDYRGMNESGLPIHNGAIYFKLPETNTITKEQFEVFKKFYEDYNQEIKIIIRKYGIKKFNVQYEYIDEEGTKTMKIITNLDELYIYLEQCIEANKLLNIDNEIILGITPNKKYKTKKLKND